MPRFYDPTAGRITIDGQDLRDVTLKSLRASVSLIQQETFLFDATCHQQCRLRRSLGRETERIVGAATAAQIHDYVANLPAQYETRVGERGVALSGGQRQRLSIARGVVHRAARLHLRRFDRRHRRRHRAARPRGAH